MKSNSYDYFIKSLIAIVIAINAYYLKNVDNDLKKIMVQVAKLEVKVVYLKERGLSKKI